VTRPLFPSRHAHAEEAQARRLELGRPALGVAEELVAAVDDHVAGLEKRPQGGDGLVDHLAGLHQEDDPSRTVQRGHEAREILEAEHAGRSLGLGLRDPLVDLLRPGVPPRHRESLLLDVEGEVLAHHAETNHAHVCVAHEAAT